MLAYASPVFRSTCNHALTAKSRAEPSVSQRQPLMRCRATFTDILGLSREFSPFQGVQAACTGQRV
jgi:hypothetical protein